MCKYIIYIYTYIYILYVYMNLCLGLFMSVDLLKEIAHNQVMQHIRIPTKQKRAFNQFQSVTFSSHYFGRQWQSTS